MTPSQKQRWLAALRSGKYEQTKGWLNKDNKFCCLGVACEVFKEDVNLTVTEEVYGGSPAGVEEYKFVKYNHSSGMLPDPLSNMLGMDKLGRLPNNVPEELKDSAGIPLSLVGLNDDHDYTFGQIADVIEKYFPANDPEPEQPQSEQTQ